MVFACWIKDCLIAFSYPALYSVVNLSYVSALFDSYSMLFVHAAQIRLCLGLCVPQLAHLCAPCCFLGWVYVVCCSVLGCVSWYCLVPIGLACVVVSVSDCVDGLCWAC